ncbi:MAG: hypothetical protein AAF959_10575 [Cyanobacteria bacterium P01_D01_bin.56]
MTSQHNSINQPTSNCGNSFGQLLLISMIEAVVVSVLSGPAHHYHFHYPAVETTIPTMCVVTEMPQQATRHNA